MITYVKRAIAQAVLEKWLITGLRADDGGEFQKKAWGSRGWILGNWPLSLSSRDFPFITPEAGGNENGNDRYFIQKNEHKSEESPRQRGSSDV